MVLAVMAWMSRSAVMLDLGDRARPVGRARVEGAGRQRLDIVAGRDVDRGVGPVVDGGARRDLPGDQFDDVVAHGEVERRVAARLLMDARADDLADAGIDQVVRDAEGEHHVAAVGGGAAGHAHRTQRAHVAVGRHVAAGIHQVVDADAEHGETAGPVGRAAGDQARLELADAAAGGQRGHREAAVNGRAALQQAHRQAADAGARGDREEPVLAAGDRVGDDAADLAAGRHARQPDPRR